MKFLLQLLDVEQANQATDVIQLPNEHSCLELSNFGSIENGVPAILHEAAELLAAQLNNANWPEMIMDTFTTDYSTLSDIHKLLQRNVNEFLLSELLLIFFWYFRCAQIGENEPKFIERAMNEQHCKITIFYLIIIAFWL